MYLTSNALRLIFTLITQLLFTEKELKVYIQGTVCIVIYADVDKVLLTCLSACISHIKIHTIVAVIVAISTVGLVL